jgi:hypothetical protein
MSQEMQNFVYLKIAAKQAAEYWSKFWSYRIGQFSIEEWCWVGGFLALFIWLMFVLLPWIDNYQLPEAAPQQRTESEILEDILKEMKK